MKAALVRLARRFARALTTRLPIPLAAPETPRLYRLRRGLVLRLAFLGLATAVWPPIVAPAVRIIATWTWLTLALASLIAALSWLRAKHRADSLWLIQSGKP